jgi:hypothetical protein
VSEAFDIKDKDKIKILSRIDEVNLEKVYNWVAKLQKIDEDLNAIETKINGINVLSVIERLNIELSQKKQSLKVIEEKMNELAKKLIITIDEEKTSIKQKMFDKFNLEVEIND